MKETMLTLLETKEKQKTLKRHNEMTHYIQGNTDTDQCELLIRNYGSQKAINQFVEMIKAKNFQKVKILYLMKRIFKNESKINPFSIK